jgi:hypothetical protein
MSDQKRPRKEKKEHRARPAYTGPFACNNGHIVDVVDLNVEHGTVNCSLVSCGIEIDIKEGIKAGRQFDGDY